MCFTSRRASMQKHCYLYTHGKLHAKTALKMNILKVNLSAEIKSVRQKIGYILLLQKGGIKLEFLKH
jgi:hypothetical protein